MSPLEHVDEWLHAYHLTWLSRAVGICRVMNRRLDRMEAEQ